METMKYKYLIFHKRIRCLKKETEIKSEVATYIYGAKTSIFYFHLNQMAVK